jgi:hypothetical protein
MKDYTQRELHEIVDSYIDLLKIGKYDFCFALDNVFSVNSLDIMLLILRKQEQNDLNQRLYDLISAYKNKKVRNADNL